jgi:histone-lysine N-methyltransferase SETD2
MVNGELCIGLYALTTINQGDELTFDYNFETYGEKIKCFCNTSKCGGWIGAAKKSDDDDVPRTEVFNEDDYEHDLAPVMMEADEEVGLPL